MRNFIKIIIFLVLLILQLLCPAYGEQKEESGSIYEPDQRILTFIDSEVCNADMQEKVCEDLKSRFRDKIASSLEDNKKQYLMNNQQPVENNEKAKRKLNVSFTMKSNNGNDPISATYTAKATLYGYKIEGKDGVTKSVPIIIDISNAIESIKKTSRSLKLEIKDDTIINEISEISKQLIKSINYQNITSNKDIKEYFDLIIYTYLESINTLERISEKLDNDRYPLAPIYNRKKFSSMVLCLQSAKDLAQATIEKINETSNFVNGKMNDKIGIKRYIRFTYHLREALKDVDITNLIKRANKYNKDQNFNFLSGIDKNKIIADLNSALQYLTTANEDKKNKVEAIEKTIVEGFYKKYRSNLYDNNDEKVSKNKYSSFINKIEITSLKERRKSKLEEIMKIHALRGILFIKDIDEKSNKEMNLVKYIEIMMVLDDLGEFGKLLDSIEKNDKPVVLGEILNGVKNNNIKEYIDEVKASFKNESDAQLMKLSNDIANQFYPVYDPNKLLFGIYFSPAFLLPVFSSLAHNNRYNDFIDYGYGAKIAIEGKKSPDTNQISWLSWRLLVLRASLGIYNMNIDDNVGRRISKYILYDMAVSAGLEIESSDLPCIGKLIIFPLLGAGYFIHDIKDKNLLEDNRHQYYDPQVTFACEIYKKLFKNHDIALLISPGYSIFFESNNNYRTNQMFRLDIGLKCRLPLF